MAYVGVDLAADPKRTAIAVLSETGTIESVQDFATDTDIVTAIKTTQHAGVDVPLGWPTPFVDFLSDHARNDLPVTADTGRSWRRNLTLRLTDQVIHERTGITPLSVSASLIAHPAMRWAGIEAHLREINIDVSRDGSGAIYEVYPAAALLRWGLPHRGYKGAENAAIRATMLAQLSDIFPDLDWRDEAEQCVRNDNVLDAVLAALIARESARGNCYHPKPNERERARSEGWIWLPKAETHRNTQRGGDTPPN